MVRLKLINPSKELNTYCYVVVTVKWNSSLKLLRSMANISWKPRSWMKSTQHYFVLNVFRAMWIHLVWNLSLKLSDVWGVSLHWELGTCPSVKEFPLSLLLKILQCFSFFYFSLVLAFRFSPLEGLLWLALTIVFKSPREPVFFDFLLSSPCVTCTWPKWHFIWRVLSLNHTPEK